MNQIIFFDGVCVLCNGFVDFVIQRDHDRLFRFSPLQGEKAKSTLPEVYIKDLNTVVLWSQGEIFNQSDAALMVLVQLGGIYSLMRIFWLVPKGIRDFFYRLAATRRYLWFGKRAVCRLPSPEERALFLD